METSNKQGVLFRDLGQIEYRDAWDLQEKLLQENVAVKAEIRNRKMAPETEGAAVGNGQLSIDSEYVMPSTQHYLLFVEHNPVYTLFVYEPFLKPHNIIELAFIIIHQGGGSPA